MCIKALQGPPLAAVVHRKLTLRWLLLLAGPAGVPEQPRSSPACLPAYPACLPACSPACLFAVLSTLQHPELPSITALLHTSPACSASGERLRASLKVQLLEEAEGRRRSMVGGRAAKQVTYWRRAGDC